MSSLPELIIHGSNTRAVDDVVTLEWRLVTRGTKPSPASISLRLEGAALRSGRVVYGTENGQTAKTDLHDQFSAEPGDLIQAFFQVVPDGSAGRITAAAVLHTPTGEHASPEAFINVERNEDVSVTWHSYDDGDRKIIEATLTAKTDIPKSVLSLDAPEQVLVEPIIMSLDALKRGSVESFRAAIDIDDDAPVTLSNARVTVGTTEFFLPSLTIEPNRRSDLELTIGGDTIHPLGEMAEAWILVKNTGRRQRVAVLQVASDELTIARTPEARIVAPGTTQRWGISYAGKRQGPATLTATLGAASQSLHVTIERSTMQSAVRGAGSFDNVRDGRYDMMFSVRDFASGSRLSVLTAPGMYPRSIIGIGGARVETPMHEDGQRYQSNVISDGDDAVTIQFASSPVDSEKDHQAAIVIFERDAHGAEYQVGSHSIIVRARAIVKNLTVSKAHDALNPHEQTGITVSANNAGAATAYLPFSLQAESFVDFSWDGDIPLTDLITVIGQSSIERHLIARLRDVPPGRTSTTIGMQIGKQTFTRVLSIRNPARVEDACVSATDDGFAIGFRNGGAVSADQAIVIIRGAEVASAIATEYNERILSVSESRVFYGPVHAGEAAKIHIRVKRYFESVNLAVVIGDSRCDLSFTPPSNDIMSFGGIEFNEAIQPEPVYSTTATESVPPIEANAAEIQSDLNNAGQNSEHESQPENADKAFPTIDELRDKALASIAEELNTENGQHTNDGEAPQGHADDVNDGNSPPNEGSTDSSDDASSNEHDPAQNHDEHRLLYVQDLLMESDLKIVDRLRAIKSQNRVIHAYIASLFVAADSDAGALIRKNIVKSLASDAVGRDQATTWTLLPQESVEWLGKNSSPEAIAYLADYIGSTPDLAPQLREYLDAIASTYRSLEGLEETPLRERLFAPAAQLDSLLNVVIPTEAHA